MTQHTHTHSSIDVSEIQRFSRISSQWWDENGPFKPLHNLNPTRIQYIRDCLVNHFLHLSSKNKPLLGLSILDIGCGGGLVTEPLTRLGATVTGIDASKEAIEVATAHASMMELPISYFCTSPEELVSQGQTFDVVLALEIVEHVPDVAEFLKICTQLVAPNGALILSTLNRTWKSYAIAILGAEYIMRMLPKGTHEWSKFLSPAEIVRILRTLGFSFANLRGLSYEPIKNQWHLSRSLEVNYLGYAKKDSTLR